MEKGPRVQSQGKALVLGDPKPAQDFLILQMAPRPEVTEGGIQIPYDQLPPLPYGLVRSKGPGCSDAYSVGQHVIVPAHAGSLIEIGDGSAMFRFVREIDIVGYFAGRATESSLTEPPAKKDAAKPYGAEK